MNRLRSEPKTHVSVFITLLLAALVMVCGGVMHAVYKNQQVRTDRLIDQSEKRIEANRTKVRMVEVRMDALLDRYEIKDRLNHYGSGLLAVTPDFVEEIVPGATGERVAAIRE